jgi:hypothetical protein
MNEKQRTELVRAKIILSGVTGQDEHDEDNIRDAYRALCRLLDEQGREPVHSLQCAHCHVTIETLNEKVMRTLAALKEWSDKTDWVQKTAQPLELGMHRADVLKQRIEHLQAEAEADKTIIEYHEATIKRLQYEVDAIPAIKEERDALAAEVLEQCRIIAMSAEREDALRAELTRLKASIALDKMAEDARTIGLRLDDWDKIGCVNHDCDKCKAVHEPVAMREVLVKIARFLGVVRVYAQDIQPKHELETDKPLHWKARELQDEVIKLIDTTPPAPQSVPVKCWCHKCNEHNTVNGLPFSMTQMILCPECGNKRCPKASDHQLDCTGSNEPNQPGSVYTAPQPVPVKTYHDGKPWPVAPKPWVGLSEKEVEAYDDWADFQVGCGRQTLFDMVRDIEAKLKGKNT